MTTHTRPVELLWVLRSVESTPPGDLDWAKHCTRQQALILRLSHPHGSIGALDTLAEITGIHIDLVSDIPTAGTAFHCRDGWRIHISNSLSPHEQTRVALHELKHIIDDPVRNNGGGLAPSDYEYLADYFAQCVLRKAKT